MIRLCSSIVAALALVMMAFAMSGGIGMTAHAATMERADGHCAGTDVPSERQNPGFEMGCAGACAGLPAVQAQAEGGVVLPETAFATVPARALAGVQPDHETPPPRSAPVI